MVTRPIHEKKLIPACFISWKNGPDYAALVDKSRQKVFVYSKKDIFNPYKIFNCSTGKNKGPKTEENDAKTPEGIYFFTKSVDDKYLTPIYGAHALPIDYPNIIDRKEGKGGYGIWFHGTDKVLKPYDSNGCIEMENRDIKELAKLITLFETPVIIESSIEMVPENKVESLRRELTEIIKKRRIDAVIKNLSLFYHNGVIVASFDQIYKTNSSEKHARKRLYLTKESNRWKIVDEISIEQKNP